LGQAATTEAAQSARKIIDRPRLLEQLDETEARTILLIAPAGYGKTVLAEQWAAELRATAWYAPTAVDRDVVALARGLARSIAPVAGGSSSWFEEFLRTADGPARNVTRIATMLSEAIASSRLARLVLDDYQVLIGSHEAEDLVNTIRARTNLTLLVTARVRPTWASARRILYGEILEVGLEELKMNAAESESLLSALPAADAEELATLASGWPAVLGLAAVAYPNLHHSQPLPDDLYNFLADEILRAVSEPLQAAMSDLALLPSLDEALIQRAMGPGSGRALTEAVTAGLLSVVHGSYQLHPLLREFLLARMLKGRGSDRRIRNAVETALASHSWETAIELVTKFELDDLFDTVLCNAYEPLLSRGQIDTLGEFAERAQTYCRESRPQVELVRSDIARRKGDHRHALELALRASRKLGVHPLRSHAYAVAGQSAFSEWNIPLAYDMFSEAHDTAQTASDRSAASWGLVLVALYGHLGNLDTAIDRLRNLRDESPVQLVRFATARIAQMRVSPEGIWESSEVSDGFHAARELLDPDVRSSFMISYGYLMGLQGLYEEMTSIAQETLNDGQSFQLTYVMPHAYWQTAFASLGLRRFGQCERALRLAERHATKGDEFQLLNNRSLRARLCLAQNHLDLALEEVGYEASSSAQTEMWEEFLATRALVLAVCGQDTDASAVRAQINIDAAPVEARALVAMASAVSAARTRKAQEVVALVRKCSSMNTWDPVVCAIRAEPDVLVFAIRDPHLRQLIGPVLARSHDYSLARRVGLRPKPTERSNPTLLSNRERDVYELLRNGLTNREIAQALFIAEATAKVHVRHVMEKLGARTRTEAAGRDLTQ
jgi:DNA-binding CsgD family transcriptional regulator